MKDKLNAGLVTALLVAPICLLCLLGPAVLGGFLAWVSVRLGGLDWGTAGVVAGLAAILIYAILRLRRAKARRHPLASRPSARN